MIPHTKEELLLEAEWRQWVIEALIRIAQGDTYVGANDAMGKFVDPLRQAANSLPKLL